ncbi:hypothetical protein Y900_029740 [Mycolicibacterium aromaticivorans JS19b1 = JCM 16368]|uniref:Diguanylate cyclase n=1 Tax=Mycolicibacterium aromaticivorans JS19b1 = JCM 16368 TaxID=1440774 RepID=A0A064CAY6_9MYCO|nr:hypothetical protein Y900_029740 [Mycolicibacterium aromaticivorans JS19b1 = JCM 16368]
MNRGGRDCSAQSDGGACVWEGDCWHQPACAYERGYRQLAERSLSPVCVHDGEVLLYVNTAFVVWMKAESDVQLVGRSLAELVHSDALDGIRAHISAMRRHGDASAPSAGVVLRLDGAAIEAIAVAVRIRWLGRPAFQVIFDEVTTQRTADDLRYQAALMHHHVSDALIATTAAGVVTSWNPAAASIYGRTAAEVVGRPVSEAVGAPLDPTAIAAGGVVQTLHHAADGTGLTVRVSAAAMDTGYVVACADLTALRRAEQHLQTVVASIDAGIIILGADGRDETVNAAAESILGTRFDVLLDEYQVDRAADIPLYEPDGRRLLGDEHPIAQTLKTGVPLTGRILGFDRIDGHRVWLSGSCRLLEPSDPHHSSVVITIHDITDQHVANQHLAHQATHDALTGLPNRAHILSRITALNHPSNGRRLGAVLFFDLDNLKTINDTMGHAAGDDVLCLAAQRLRDAIDPEDMVGRWGGDEFVILLFGDLTHTDVDRQEHSLHTLLSAPVNLQGAEVRICGSIGSALVGPDERRSAIDILRVADRAMYRAKKRNRVSNRDEEQWPDEGPL